MIDVYSLPVHPAADVWPMIGDDELTQLAADISENGLIDPIVVGEVDGKMMLIDGRNRLAACGMVGVEPTVEQLNGHDPVAYILSKNENRRHMKKYQRAMAVAMMFPEGQQGKRNDLTSQQNIGKLNDNYLRQARRVLAYANKRENNDPMLAKEVLEGDTSLSEAYDKVKEAEKKPVLTKAQRRENVIKEAPDLGNLIRDDLAGLAEAEAALKARKDEERIARESLVDACSNSLGLFARACCHFAHESSEQTLSDLFTSEDFITQLPNNYIGGKHGFIDDLEKMKIGASTIINVLENIKK